MSDLDFSIHSNKSGKSKNKTIQYLINKDNFLRKIFRFFVPQVSRQIIRNKIKNFNKTEFNYQLLADKQRHMLFKEYFNNDIKKLEELVGKKMNWNKL